jgi:hypothetical protein
MRWPLIALCALLAAWSPGCGRVKPAAESSVRKAAEHVTPAHRPDQFPEAVARLRDLHRAFSDPSTGPTSPTRLQQYREIAAWLPEIAADSDMPEGEWDRVDAAARGIAAALRDVESATPADRPARYVAQSRVIEPAIAALEAIRAASNPEWFRVPRRSPEPPSSPARTASEAPEETTAETPEQSS